MAGLPLCWIHGMDFKMWTDVVALICFSLDRMAPILVQLSVFVVLILVLSFLAPQVCAGEMFWKGEAGRKVEVGLFCQETVFFLNVYLF